MTQITSKKPQKHPNVHNHSRVAPLTVRETLKTLTKCDSSTTFDKSNMYRYRSSREQFHSYHYSNIISEFNHLSFCTGDYGGSKTFVDDLDLYYLSVT